MKIDVIIPLYKPGKELLTLLEMLHKQTLPPHQIILMNTEEKYLEALKLGSGSITNSPDGKVYHLSKREFDHGGTRRRGVLKSDAEVFVMMTQDAMPADEYLLERLVRNLSGRVAVAYARQLATEKSGVMEQLTRTFNYPEESRIKTFEDLPVLGIKTFFCSNVCAAYRRDIYEELGGFIKHTIFNEDMIYAAGAVKKGYAISYEAQAMVYHSHDYTNMQQLRRNFDLGVSQAEHPEIFGEVKSESEGKRLVMAAGPFFKEHHMLSKLPHFYMQCGCKYIGYLLGKHYKSLPRKLVLRITTNPEYWKK